MILKKDAVMKVISIFFEDMEKTKRTTTTTKNRLWPKPNAELLASAK